MDVQQKTPDTLFLEKNTLSYVLMWVTSYDFLPVAILTLQDEVIQLASGRKTPAEALFQMPFGTRDPVHSALLIVLPNYYTTYNLVWLALI